MARFDLTEFERLHEPVLPTDTRGARTGQRPACPERHLLAAADGCALARPAGTLWSSHYSAERSRGWVRKPGD